MSSTAFRTIFLTKPWRPFPRNLSLSPSFFPGRNPHSARGCKPFKARNDLLFSVTHNLNYSANEVRSSLHDDCNPNPPQEAVLKAISEVSKVEGRIGQTTNLVMGGTVHDDSTNEWLVLDKKVNLYPTERMFTAIGTGGDDFVQAMVVAVESVIQGSILEGQVKKKDSSGGKYVSVNIGPILVLNSEQVQAVYNAMRRDDRMKYFL
ncbi:unnamed protein product [Cuscuta epithymum]|uniref:Uncharacterized protein n=1 Tax=Cuscuta epithymum TaxID=186058 RepID=A0AAV0CPL6_9ASTE|nr:unnamed protein product [Cuscuta epithymum]